MDNLLLQVDSYKVFQTPEMILDPVEWESFLGRLRRMSRGSSA